MEKDELLDLAMDIIDVKTQKDEEFSWDSILNNDNDDDLYY